MEKQLITIDAKEFGIEENKANELTSGLTTILQEREILSEAYKDVMLLDITEENLQTFRELRLKIRDNRTKGIEKWHKVNKEFFLTGGRFIDAIKNKEIAENERMEESLLSAEKHFENLEKERLEKLQNERLSLVSPFLENTLGLDLKSMDEEMFNNFFTGAKLNFESKKELERLELERIEKERIAEVEKQKAIQEENNRLKKEREEIEKELEKERKIQAEKEAKLKAENDLKLKKEREEREKIEAELKAKKEAEEKAEKQRLDKIESERKEAEKLSKAPIKKQMSVWVNSFELPRINLDNETSKEIIVKFESFKKWSLSQIENL